jgi:hypothetical protein
MLAVMRIPLKLTISKAFLLYSVLLASWFWGSNVTGIDAHYLAGQRGKEGYRSKVDQGVPLVEAKKLL